MKRNFKYIAMMMLLAVCFTACEKQSAGRTGVVDYVVLKLQGESQIFLPIGDPFVEPGWTATDKGKDVHDDVIISIIDMLGNSVDEVTTDASGIFTIYYTATSEDKMTITESRQVFVYDPTLSVSLKGQFDVDFAASARIDGSRNWTWSQWYDYYSDEGNNGAIAAYAQKAVTIDFKELAPGIYEVSDLLGGFYGSVRGLGPYYAATNGSAYLTYFDMQGMVVLNADLTLDLVSSHIQNWNDGLEGLSGTYDEESKKLDLHSIYGGGMDFNVVMVKK